MRKSNSQHIRSMVILSMFAAMAYVAMLVIHIKVSFLTLDVKDAVITLCGLYFGPAAALIISVLVPVLELFTVSETGIYGLIMNILGSLTFSVSASFIYKWRKTLWGAILALVSAAFATTGVMLLANLFITPYYMGVSGETVRALIPTLLLPFNLLKATLNVGIVLLLYKHLGRVLRRVSALPAHTAKGEDTAVSGARNPGRSLLVTVAAVVLIAVSLVIIFAVLGGKMDFGVTKA